MAAAAAAVGLAAAPATAATSGTFTATGSMNAGHTHAKATLLQNGQVLVSGDGGTPELYNRLVLASGRGGPASPRAHDRAGPARDNDTASLDDYAATVTGAAVGLRHFPAFTRRAAASIVSGAKRCG